MNLKSVYHKVKETFPSTEIEVWVEGESSLSNIIKKLFNLKWDFKWVEIHDNEDDFECDIETALEHDENIFDENVKITKEICFESTNQDVVCRVYSDENFNINRMFLNID